MRLGVVKRESDGSHVKLRNLGSWRLLPPAHSDKMSKPESALDVVRRVLDKDVPNAVKEIMADKKLSVEEKTSLMAMFDGVLQMLRLIRARLEV